MEKISKFNTRRAWKKNPKLINVGPTIIPESRVPQFPDKLN